jgi:hypothetical protein
VTTHCALLALAIAAALAPGVARGAPAAKDANDADHTKNAPWAQGVDNARQDAANALYAQGNDLFARGAQAEAADKYRAALAIWDHPLIRFNLAVALIRLDRMLEAADEIDGALRYGDKPFAGSEHYQQALDYQALIAHQLVTLETVCTQASTRVLLDGKPWFTCPGSAKVRLLAGEHLLVGEGGGYLTATDPLVLVGGTQTTKHVELVRYERAVMLRYRFPPWQPWTATGGGAAIAIGGLALWLVGRSDIDKFEADWTHACPQGCTLASQPALADSRSSALLDGKLGIGIMVAGGAIAVSGVVLVLLDRPERVVPHLQVVPERGGVSVGYVWQR